MLRTRVGLSGCFLVLLVALVSASSPSEATPAPRPERFVLIGDSVAHTLGEALEVEGERRGLDVRSVTRTGCGLTTSVPVALDGSVPSWAPACSKGTAAYQEAVVAEHRPDVVIWESIWEATDHVFAGATLREGTPEWDRAMLRDFEASRRRLTAGGARLVVLTVAPDAQQFDLGGPPSFDAIRRVLQLNDLLEQFAARHRATVILVDLARIVCPSGPPCPEWRAGVRPRGLDGGHYTPEGAMWVAPRLLDAVTKALRTLR